MKGKNWLNNQPTSKYLRAKQDKAHIDIQSRQMELYSPTVRRKCVTNTCMFLWQVQERHTIWKYQRSKEKSSQEENKSNSNPCGYSMGDVF